MTTVSTALANVAPEETRGFVFGIDASAIGLANAVGPLAGATLAARLGLRGVFFCVGLILALTGLAMTRLPPGPRVF